MPPRPKLKIVELPTAALHPNPWNPNVQQPQVARALSESIDHYGMIEPVTVRPHPELDDEYQIINGEHRWREAVERELEVVPCIILQLTDAQARKLTVILNEVSGDADVALLGKLLVEVQDLLPDDEALGLALPYSDMALQHLLTLGNEAWDEFTGHMPRDGDGLHTLVVKFAEGDMNDLTNYLDIIERELETDRAGAVLEACRRVASEVHSAA